ncbi:FMN-binding glutamate synthase family protein [Arhodomonas sp. AD133]|uniref:FMN-binding glutamate synthase family protein n=1 Tax=Arhodomonas sp. AD133 TaxID=3415009 RepID=UPI003EBFE7AB
MRYLTYFLICGLTVIFVITSAFYPPALALLAPLALLAAIGTYDLMQTRHNLWRNYPIISRFRWMFEAIRPELRQYLFESDTDGRPFSREQRSLVYRRAKAVNDKNPFGTLYDLSEPGYEWIAHSMTPLSATERPDTVRVGGPQCERPYHASRLNISAMSFGALSANAIHALNRGACAGGFAHNTGEGGVSRYHLEGGGDLVWQIASGYFGCRAPNGAFDPDRFAETAASDQIAMIEIKLSQGAKPGHGGILPGPKVTAEIATARGVQAGVDCISPASHPAFSTPVGLLEFIAELRTLSGGKPIGFKLCVGQPDELMAIVKAIIDTGIYPDFIVVDGAEGGTGSAPLELSNRVGTPLREALIMTRNILVGAGLRDHIRIAASGKVTSGYWLASNIALGADWCYSARGFMFALGCVQSLSCHNDRCPTGVATQNPTRQRALVVPDKARRVTNFQRNTVHALMEIVATAGLQHPGELRPAHVCRHLGAGEVGPLSDYYTFLEPGQLLDGSVPEPYARWWRTARSTRFAAAD